MVPTVKHEIRRQCPNVIKERLPSTQCGPQPLVLGIHERKDGMEQKRQQIERHQRRRQMVLPMPKVMLKMIALGFQHIVVLIFDLPAGTPCCHHPGHHGITQWMQRRKRVVVELRAGLFVCNRQLTPIRQQRIVATRSGTL